MARLLGICGSVATLLIIAAGCASASKDGGVDRAVNKTQAGFGDAALTPLSDLNLRRTEIPQKLVALQSPYEPIPVLTCKAIGAEVVELTKILGDDADAPPKPEDTLEQQAGSGAASLALSGVSSITDVIPFRSVVRAATGATEHERQLRLAYERGVARRAYMKGVGAQLGCAPPAAPDPGGGVPLPPDIEYRGKSQAPVRPAISSPG
jgi:hypothetical protein